MPPKNIFLGFPNLAESGVCAVLNLVEIDIFVIINLVGMDIVSTFVLCHN